MCQCTPEIKTPFCGKPGCEWPKPEQSLNDGELSEFSARLRGLRERLAISQADLAASCGLEPSAISHFECGRREPSFANLVKLVDAMGCDPGYLLGTRDNFGKHMDQMESALKELKRLAVTNVDGLPVAAVGWLAMKGLGEVK